MSLRYAALNSRVVERSIVLGKPIVVVSINYRYLSLSTHPNDLNVLKDIHYPEFLVGLSIRMAYYHF